MLRSLTALPDEQAGSHVEVPTGAGLPFRLSGPVLGARPHICAFFNTPDEEYRALLPFVREGLVIGQKAVHTVDPRRREVHLQRLASAGVKVDSLQRKGQLEVRDWSSTHLRSGRFDPAETLGLFQEIAREARRRGFSLVRFVTQMEWFLETGLEADELLEYEARANDVWMRPDGPIHPVICAYNLTRFTADVVADVMRTHPMVLIGGILHENPFFVPPEDFLRQLREKRPVPLKYGNDLMGILTLPALWSGREPSQILPALVEVVLRSLALDFAYAEVRPRRGGVIETCRFADSGGSRADMETVRGAVKQRSASEPNAEVSVVLPLAGSGNLTAAIMPVSTTEYTGEIVVGSRRAEFPTETDRFLLRVAANHAAVALQDALLHAGQLRSAKPTPLQDAPKWTQADRDRQSVLGETEKLYASLTPREREVLPYIVAGFLSKQTAAELGTSEITIRVHRGQIMRKMRAQSLAELIRMADKLGVHIPPKLGPRKS